MSVAADPEARIVLVTTFDLDGYLEAGRRAGACAFLLAQGHRAGAAARPDPRRRRGRDGVPRNNGQVTGISLKTHRRRGFLRSGHGRAKESVNT
jgi:hypothetical protein